MESKEAQEVLKEENISAEDTKSFFESGDFSLNKVLEFINKYNISKETLEKLGEIIGLK